MRIDLTVSVIINDDGTLESELLSAFADIDNEVAARVPELLDLGGVFKAGVINILISEPIENEDTSTIDDDDDLDND